MDSACPEKDATEILSDSDHSTKVAPTTLTVYIFMNSMLSFSDYGPCELRAPEDFLKRRYNLLDTSATRVVHYRLKRQESSP